VLCRIKMLLDPRFPVKPSGEDEWLPYVLAIVCCVCCWFVLVLVWVY